MFATYMKSIHKITLLKLCFYCKKMESNFRPKIYSKNKSILDLDPNTQVMLGLKSCP